MFIFRQSQTAREVPIVPYWNWNLTMFSCSCSGFFVPIVPYWNWNGIPCFRGLFHTGSNRTLLELKSGTTNNIAANPIVPIVPYWNWNKARQSEIRQTGAFQSYLTGIEIKDIRIGGGNGIVPIVPYWNLNILWYVQRPHTGCSNRTLLELKYIVSYKHLGGKPFQSYLTGIEMR